MKGAPGNLPDEWRARAEQMRRWGAGAEVAHVWELAAEELASAIREAGDEPLTLDEAARESGYSKRRLREMVAEGRVPNAGRKNAPRIRRADLPRRPGRATAADAPGIRSDALRLMAS